MIYFTSDLHLGHENAIAFTNRPFANLEEMNQKLIGNINETVQADDELWILGDFAYKIERSSVRELRGQISCKHVHLVYGNHDRDYSQDHIFQSVQHYTSTLSVSRILRHLHPSSKDFVHTFLHTKTDTGTITAPVTRRSLFRRSRQVIAILFPESAPKFPVLPEEAASATFRSVCVVTHSADHDCFFSHRIILLFHDDSAEPAEMKKARLPFRTATGLCNGGFSSEKTKTPSRVGFLLSVSNEYKTGLE